MPTHDCPKCRARMEEGFVLDSSRYGIGVSRWVEGTPEKSLWHGMKTKGKRQMDVTTYRCTRCGYLELYAR